jgi:hypothetical protein
MQPQDTSRPRIEEIKKGRMQKTDKAWWDPKANQHRLRLEKH